MNGTGSLTIPLLPCVSWDDTLEFWQMLGFEVALKQRSPNAYAVREVEILYHPGTGSGLMVTNHLPRCGSRVRDCSTAVMASLVSRTPVR